MKDPTTFTVAELKSKLRQLNLNTSGNKAEQILRSNEILQVSALMTSKRERVIRGEKSQGCFQIRMMKWTSKCQGRTLDRRICRKRSASLRDEREY